MHYRLRLAVLCATCCLVFALVGLLLGVIALHPLAGIVLGALFGAAYCFVGYMAAERFALDIYDARVVEASTSPNLYKTVAKLAAEIGVEAPVIYSLPYGGPNAYCIARAERGSVIVLTNALMNDLDPEEVRAILALMIARIAENDSAANSVAATLAGMPLYCLCHLGFREWIRKRLKSEEGTGITVLEKALISTVLPACIFPLRLAYSRSLQADSDAVAARLVGSAGMLSSALAKIDAAKPADWWGNTAFNPATGILFAVPPLAGRDVLTTESPFLIRTQSVFEAITPTVEERMITLMSDTADAPAPAPPPQDLEILTF